MIVQRLYKDIDLSDSKVQQGYLLVFYSVDSKGNIIKRYKDSEGNFGTLAGASTGMSDAEAEEIIVKNTTTAESDVEITQAYLVSANDISNTLDSIIGE